MAAAAARAQAKGVARLERRHQHLGVGEIGLPGAAQTQIDLVAGRIAAAFQSPRLAMGALDLAS